MVKPVYLDHNATTPILPEVIEAMTAVMSRVGNASSVHGFGRDAKALVERAREQVAALVGAERPQDVIFCGSGTEANTMAIRAFPDLSFFPSAVEHDAVLQARAPKGMVTVDQNGQLQGHMPDGLLALQLANNEVGTIQDLPQAPHLHVDAVQAAGKIPVSMPGLGCQTLALSAHKLGGPQGIGALVIRPGLDIAPLIPGGGQERRRRGGTENVAGIVGFGLAAEKALENQAHFAQHTLALRDALEANLPPKVHLLASGSKRLPNTSCLAFEGKRAETLLMKFDLAGIAVSSGSACSSGKVGSSHVLTAMGVPENLAQGAVRLSFGRTSKQTDVTAALAVIAKIAATT